MDIFQEDPHKFIL